MNHRSFVVALLLVGASSAALAQTKTPPPRPKPRTVASTRNAPAAAPAAAPEEKPSDASIDARANALTDNMQKNLALTPAQTEKVRVINRRAVERVENLRVHYRTNPAKMQSMVDNVSDSRLSSLKDVLAPAQFDKYQRKREEKMGLPNTQGVQGNAPPGLGGGGE